MTAIGTRYVIDRLDPNQPWNPRSGNYQRKGGTGKFTNRYRKGGSGSYGNG